MTCKKFALGRSVSLSIILFALLMCFAAGFMPHFAFGAEVEQAQTPAVQAVDGSDVGGTAESAGVGGAESGASFSTLTVTLDAPEVLVQEDTSTAETVPVASAPETPAASETPAQPVALSAAEDFVGPRLLQIAADTGSLGSVNYQVDTSNTLILSATSGTAGTLPTWSDKAGAVATLPWLSDTALRARITSFKVTAGHTISVPAGGSLAGMFAGLNALSSCNLAGLNTANAISMASMFEGCVSLTSINISTFKTGKCQDMSSMFKGCTNLQTADLTLIATLNVTNMTSMFEGCSNLTTIKADDGFEVVNSYYARLTGKTKTASANMFAGCVKLVGSDGTHYSGAATDCDMAQVDNARYFPGYFTKVIDSSGIDFAIYSATDNSLRFYKRQNMPAVNQVAWDGYHTVTAIWKGRGSSALNSGCYLETYYGNDYTLEGGTEGWAMNTHNITAAPWARYMSDMKSILVVDWGIKPTYTAQWFLNASRGYGFPEYQVKLETVKMKALDTSIVKYTHSMFNFAADSGNGWLYNRMATNLKLIDVRGWDTSNFENINSFFRGTGVIELDLTSWNTSKINYSPDDIHVFEWSFSNNRQLKTIWVGPGWSAPSGTKVNQVYMFAESTALVGSAGTTYSESRIIGLYARVDGGSSSPGYLSMKTGTYAVFQKSDGSLTFIEGTNRPQADSSDIIVYEIPTAALTSADNQPWAAIRDQIRSVKTNGLVAVKSIAYWFSKFANCTSFDIANLTTDKLVDVSHLFEGATLPQNFDISTWKTGSVQNMSYMFKGCTSLQTLNLTRIATFNVTNMTSMFEGCSNLTTIWADDGFEVVDSFIARQTGKTKTASANMFAGCVKLVGGEGTRFVASATDCEMAQVDNSRYYPGYFTKVINEGAKAFAIYSATDNSLRFYKRPNMPAKNSSANQWDGYHQVTEVWDCGNAAHPEWDFEQNCYEYYYWLGDGNSAPWKRTGSVPWKAYMADIKVVNVCDYGIAPKYLDVWFYSAISGAGTHANFTMYLEAIKMRALDASKIVNMFATFDMYSSQDSSRPIKLKMIDVRGWNTSSLTGMNCMLKMQGSPMTEIDLSSWDTSKVIDMGNAFADQTALKTIYIGDKWSTAKVTNAYNLFGSMSSNLKGQNGTTWTSSMVGNLTYARIDGNGGLGLLSSKVKSYALFLKDEGTLILSRSPLRPIPPGSQDVVFDLPTSAFTSSANQPWASVRGEVRSVKVNGEFNTTNTAYWFSGFSNCNSYDLAGLTFAKITSMANMFAGATGLQSLDMSGWPLTSAMDLSSLFKGCTNLVSVAFPPGVTSIANNMFEGCSSLALTALPAYVTTIGNSAFEGCSSLALGGLPSGVTSIGNSAFEGCTSIAGAWTLSNVVAVGERAFAGCTGLQALTFSESLSNIGAGAFAGTTGLQSVSFAVQRAPRVTSTAGTLNPASTLFTGSPAVIKVPYGTSGTVGYDAQGWELFRLRLDGVDYYDPASDPHDQEANNVGVFEAYKDSSSPVISSGWYVLNGALGNDITFANRIIINGDVKVILVGHKLITPKGIEVPEGSVLTFYSKVANDPYSGVVAGVAPEGAPVGSGIAPGDAAIGGSAGSNTGTINTGGVNITAQGGEGAAGIGAGQGGSIGTINIPGGTVVATGGQGASGVGGAVGSTAGTINITGGTVNGTGNNAPGVGAPEGTTGVLVIDVIGEGHVIATNNGGDIVVGSAAHPDTTNMDIGGVIIAATGEGNEPNRDNIGCDNPVVEKGGVILVVKDPDSVEENGNSIKLKEPSVLIVKGYEGGVEVSGNHVDGTTVTVTPTGEEEIKLNPGAKMTFKNSAGKEVTITAPDNANGPSSIKLTDKNHIQLAADVTVQVDGKPLVVKPGETLSSGAYGTATDDTRAHNSKNPLNVGFNQAVTEMVDPEKGILKTEDSNRYSCGFDVSVWLEILDQVASADAEKVAASLGESTLGKAVDINLWYKADGRDAVQVTDTAGVPIKVKFNVPAELLEFAKNIKRTFSILRVHDGVVSTLGTFKAEDLADGLAQFESTKFSTFALAYADEVIPEPAKPEENAGGAGDNTGNNKGTEGGTTDSTTVDSNLSATPESPDTAGAAQQAGSKVQARGSSAGAAPATGDNTPWVPVAPIAAALAALIALAAFGSRRSRMAA